MLQMNLQKFWGTCPPIAVNLNVDGCSKLRAPVLNADRQDGASYSSSLLAETTFLYDHHFHQRNASKARLQRVDILFSFVSIISGSSSSHSALSSPITQASAQYKVAGQVFEPRSTHHSIS